MILLLRILFLGILASMLWVTSWAGLQCPLFGIPRPVASHPWFIATLLDAYWGFVTFYVWVCYRETTRVSRAVWFLAIITLGNIAMSSYCLAALSGAPAGGHLAEILVARKASPRWLGFGLAAAGVLVTLAALAHRSPT